MSAWKLDRCHNGSIGISPKLGASKVTARLEECRIVSQKDFSAVPRDRLERVLLAFEAALKEEGNPRATSL